MNETWAENAADWLAEYVWFWPLTLMTHMKSAPVRLLCFAAYMVWVLPGTLIAGLPLLFLMFADMIIHVTRGDL